MTWRVAIVGAGGISRSHARACRSLPDVELAAVCDTRAAAAEQLAAEFDAGASFTSVEALLQQVEHLDLAIVATWGSSHAPVTEVLARSGRVRSILCEKPFAMNAAEAEQMAHVAEQHHVLLAEAFRLRHQPVHHRAIELIREGRIGDVVHVQGLISARVPLEERRPELNWRYNPACGGGATYDIGCYCINHARWVMGAEPEVVQAFGRWGEISGVDEHVVGSMVFPGQRTASWTVSWDSDAGQVAEVYGTRGALRMEGAWHPDDTQATMIELRDSKGAYERVDAPPVVQFTVQLQHMLDSLATGQPHRVPASAAVAQMRVIDAVYASLRNGGAPVPVAKPDTLED